MAVTACMDVSSTSITVPIDSNRRKANSRSEAVAAALLQIAVAPEPTRAGVFGIVLTTRTLSPTSSWMRVVEIPAMRVMMVES